MYVGAVVALRGQAHPEQRVQVAHSLRELMEKLPRYLATEATDESHKAPVTLGHQVNLMREVWQGVEPPPRDVAELATAREPERIVAFLQHCLHFFEWHRRDRQSRKTADRAVIVQLVGSELSEPLMVENAHRWRALADFFTNLSHHRKDDVSHSEFAARKAELEAFLLERLVPRTFEDFDAIDDLLGGTGA